MSVNVRARKAGRWRGGQSAAGGDDWSACRRAFHKRARRPPPQLLFLHTNTPIPPTLEDPPRGPLSPHRCGRAGGAVGLTARTAARERDRLGRARRPCRREAVRPPRRPTPPASFPPHPPPCSPPSSLPPGLGIDPRNAAAVDSAWVWGGARGGAANPVPPRPPRRVPPRPPRPRHQAKGGGRLDFFSGVTTSAPQPGRLAARPHPPTPSPTTVPPPAAPPRSSPLPPEVPAQAAAGGGCCPTRGGCWVAGALGSDPARGGGGRCPGPQDGP